jgi:hypothetical protein
VADEPDELLDDYRTGLLATAVILDHLRTTYRRPPALTLCLYGAGVTALGFRRDCLYSRRVARLTAGLRQRLGSELVAWRDR